MSLWHPYARLAFNWITPTDDVAISNAAEVSIGAISYTLFKQMDILFSGTIRTYFELRNTAAFSYGRVYRNDTPVGTEHSTTSTSYVAFTEDIGGWIISDAYQIYACTNNASYPVSVRNQQVRGLLYYNPTPNYARVVK
jgi:hypothetical protein